MTKLKENEFRCAVCKEVYEKGWSDEEMNAERKANGWEDKDCELICDYCYNILMEWKRRQN
jgi:hypothetical protein